MTTTKKVILISVATVIAGTATWFFWLRKRNAVTEDDRSLLMQATVEEVDEDSITRPLVYSPVR